MIWVDPRTWVDTEVGSYRYLNQDLRDAQNWIYNRITCRVSNSANITTTTGVAKTLTFDTDDWDTDTIHDTVSNTSRLTAPIDGIYEIKFSALFAANATGYREVKIVDSRSFVVALDRKSALGGSLTTPVTAKASIELRQGDYVEVTVTQNSGGNLDILTGNFGPFFSMSWAGENTTAPTWTTPKTWAYKEPFNATKGNAQIRDDTAYLHHPPAVRVDKGILQSVNTATPTTVNWLGSEQYDTDTMHDGAINTSRLTANDAGIYRIWTNIEFPSNATGYRSVSIKVNGTYVASRTVSAVSGATTALTVSIECEMTAGQYAEIEVYQTSGGALSLASTGTEANRCGMEWIGLSTTNTWITPKSWRVSEYPLYTEWNSYLRDQLQALAGPKSCHVYDASVQSISTATWSAVVFDSERWDNDTLHDTISSKERITATTAGKYRAYACVGFAANATGQRLIRIIKNGTIDLVYEGTNAISGVAFSLDVTVDVELAVGDFVVAEVYQNSGGALNTLQAGNYTPEFGVSLISEV